MTSLPGSGSAPTTEQMTPSELYSKKRRKMIEAERARVLEIRSTGRVAHEIVEEVLAMLDVEESMLTNASDNETERVRAAQSPLVLRGRLRGPAAAAVTGGAGRDRGVQRLHPRGQRVGAPADVPGLRPRRVLRLLAQDARDRALPRVQAPGDALRRARQSWRWCFLS